MAGQPQADHPEAALVEALTQSSQAVGRVGQAVEQQHAAGRPVGRELEAAVPIRRPASRVGSAAGTVARESPGGPGLCQGISPLEALKTYTWNGAYAASQQAEKGSIEVGKLADMVLLDEDPTRVDPERLRHIKANITIIGGKVVWQRQG